MLAANALEQNPDIGDEELLDILSSNLCRCTGYQNIIKAVRAAATRCAARGGGMRRCSSLARRPCEGGTRRSAISTAAAAHGCAQS